MRKMDLPQRQGQPPLPHENNMPKRIVVGVNGAYWRDFGDFYSMCPVSSDNDPVEIFAIYVREKKMGDYNIVALDDADKNLSNLDDISEAFTSAIQAARAAINAARAIAIDFNNSAAQVHPKSVTLVSGTAGGKGVIVE